MSEVLKDSSCNCECCCMFNLPECIIDLFYGTNINTLNHTLTLNELDAIYEHIRENFNTTLILDYLIQYYGFFDGFDKVMSIYAQCGSTRKPHNWIELEFTPNVGEVFACLMKYEMFLPFSECTFFYQLAPSVIESILETILKQNVCLNDFILNIWENRNADCDINATEIDKMLLSACSIDRTDCNSRMSQAILGFIMRGLPNLIEERLQQYILFFDIDEITVKQSIQANNKDLFNTMKFMIKYGLDANQIFSD